MRGNILLKVNVLLEVYKRPEGAQWRDPGLLREKFGTDTPGEVFTYK
jgi:hypothetical protein